ncbi:LysE family transporter [Mesorhizobium sp. M1399]|uniref:LysE family translocator n=1 Tax=Mesorhizobium sp. M1399 TaxID=2957096 RepID=UPI003338F660
MSNSLLPSTAMLQFLAAYTVIMITPGPIGLATGSLASLHGFGRTVPLVAGIGAGTAVLAVLVALGAVHLSGSLSVPAVKIAGAAVLGWMALRIARTAPPAVGDEPQRRQAGLFAGGFLISILSPETATFFAVTFMGLMLPIRNSNRSRPSSPSSTLAGTDFWPSPFRVRSCALPRCGIIGSSAGRRGSCWQCSPSSRRRRPFHSAERWLKEARG